MVAKTTNYTPEMTAKLLARYAEVGNEGLGILADEFNKPVRSIRAKLVRESAYVAPEKKAGAKKDGPGKKEIIAEINAIGFDATGFDGATKEALVRLRDTMVKVKDMVASESN